MNGIIIIGMRSLPWTYPWHHRKSFRPNAFDVGVDVNGFIPRTYDEIVESISDVRNQGNKTGGIQ
jgi:hypothetical protein